MFTKKFDIENIKDESRLDMWVDKPDTQVFESVKQPRAETGEHPATSTSTTATSHT